MGMKKSLGILTAFALASSMGQSFPEGDIVYQKEAAPDWERKKCKSCKHFNKAECRKKYISPLSQACREYEKRNK